MFAGCSDLHMTSTTLYGNQRPLVPHLLAEGRHLCSRACSEREPLNYSADDWSITGSKWLSEAIGTWKDRTFETNFSVGARSGDLEDQMMQVYTAPKLNLFFHSKKRHQYHPSSWNDCFFAVVKVLSFLRFQVLTAASMKLRVFWDVLQCS
jgi:hypothetical protein